jgi:hypothetical protein
MIVKNNKSNGTTIVKKCPQFNGTSQGLNKLVYIKIVNSVIMSVIYNNFDKKFSLRTVQK